MITATITSAYYAEKYIESKLMNLAMSSAEFLPVIVCQGGSFEHDAVFKSLKKILWKTKPVIITTPNIPSLYAAWNLAISIVHADYYISANTDDTFTPTGIEVLIKRIEESKTDICYGSIAFKDNHSTKIMRARSNSLKMLKQRCYLTPFPIWRQSLHERFGKFDETFLVRGDHEFWLRCVSGGATIGFTKEVVGQFLWRQDNLERRYRDISDGEAKRIHAMYPA